MKTMQIDPSRRLGHTKVGRRLEERWTVFLFLSFIWIVVQVAINTMLGFGNAPKTGQTAGITRLTEAAKRQREMMKSLPKYPINHRYERPGRPLPDQAISQCHKALWHTLETTTYVLPDNETFIITGDIEDLWLRDSAAQIHPLLIPSVYNGKSLVQMDAKLERIVSGLIRTSSRLIRFDPYANSFKMENSTHLFTQFEKEELWRHGYVASRNYELDSGCYFMRMLYFFYVNFPSHSVLKEKEVREAVVIMVDLWIAEQRHDDDAYPVGELFDCLHCGTPYRYHPNELKDGKGAPTNSSAGLTWSGFRPSDDPDILGYLIPANMFTVVVLGYMMDLAEKVWYDKPLLEKAKKLREEIDAGIKRHGIVDYPPYGKIYAYEVDGFGQHLLMDDANVPSLLSIPYLGYNYDKVVFANTYRFILSEGNPWFHQGKSEGVEYWGIGSPHTARIPNSIWPMALIMQGLVSNNSTEKVVLVEKLLASSAGEGWMHESFNPNNPTEFSRPWFCWPDSLFAELVMSLTQECPRPRNGKYSVKEWRDNNPVNGSAFEKKIREDVDADSGIQNRTV